MRINMNKYSEGRGGFTGANGTVTGRLFLVDNPVNPLHAAPKQYVDAAVDSIGASNLVNGSIPVARLPAFTGEFSSVAGTNSLLLGPSGVTVGTYGKVTVDSKGRVTNGSALLDNEIPSLDWGKIDGNSLPTTLSAYGITDSLGVSGGTLTVFLTLHANPISDFHTATKEYVDTALSSTSGLAVGDIVRKSYITTPSGFLKCNGAYLSNTTYSDLFAVIGNSYDVSNPSPSTQFTLPDLTISDSNYPGSYTYIKI